MNKSTSSLEKNYLKFNLKVQFTRLLISIVRNAYLSISYTSLHNKNIKKIHLIVLFQFFIDFIYFRELIKTTGGHVSYINYEISIYLFLKKKIINGFMGRILRFSGTKIIETRTLIRQKNFYIQIQPRFIKFEKHMLTSTLINGWV